MEILERKVKELLSRPGAEKDPCPSELELAGLIEGTLSAPDEERVKAHLARCPQCLEAVRLGLALEDEPAGPVPESALNRARSVFKPSLGKRLGLFIIGLFSPVRAGVPSFAVRGAELAGATGLSGYVKDLGPFRCEVEVEKAHDDRFSVVVWIYERDSKKTVSGLRVSLMEQSRELESLVLEKGRAVFEPVPAGAYLLKVSRGQEMLGGLMVRIKGGGK